MQYSAVKLFAVLIFIPGISAAEGTLDTSELEKLFRQQPTVYEAVISTITLSDVALAKIRLGAHFKILSGARVGPYKIPGKVKASQKKIDVVLCTDVAFVGKNGTKLPDERIEDAVEIQESLTMVVLHEPTRTWLSCP